jgi:hybrid cluster-associated redox disulfide protein
MTGIDETQTVSDVMRRWPATVAVFVRRRMACPGCAMAGFMTVAAAAREYRLPPAELLAELRAVARGQGAVRP